MNLKKILISILALSIAASFASCRDKNKCDGHVDKDDNGKCDVCDEAYEDGDEEPEIVKEQCSFTVVDSDGNKVAGAKFTLTLGSVTETLTSDASGTAAAELYPGNYTVEFDYDTIPSGFLPSTPTVKVTSTDKSFDLLLVNNNPNGTEERPYFISEDETPLDLSASEEIYYVLRGGAGKKLVIESDKVSVTFNGDTYEPENGIVEVPITAGSEVMQLNNFSVKNNTASECQIVIKLVSPLGAMDNPIVMTENTITASAPTDSSVYYKWTATSGGMLVVTSTNEKNNITMTNTATNAVSAQTDGSLGEFMTVSAGDEILISVSAKAKRGDEPTVIDIEFSLEIYAGTADAPIPVIKDYVDISLDAGASLVFAVSGAANITVEDEDAKVTYNGTEFTPSSLGIINVALSDGENVFILTNTSDAKNGITVEIQ